jgi:hypothetical protein
MDDRMALLTAALIVAPIACSHAEGEPKAPPGAPSAGAYEVAPAPNPTPSTTSEPKGVEDDGQKLNDTPRQTDPTGTAPISDSRTRTTPFLVAQPNGGSSQGGFGGVGLSSGTGGTIITLR